MQNSYKNHGKILKRCAVLLVVLFAVSIVLGYASGNVYYKEYRYRVEKNSGKSSSQGSPAVALPARKTGIVLESRTVNIRNGLGRGGWRLEKRITLANPNDRDLESAYMNLPRSWYSYNDKVTIVKTSDSRWYWWEKDGSLHFYVMIER
jgi:hypothetical protein